MFPTNFKIPIQREGFRKDIQVLRGIAVISVMLFHFNSELFKNGFLGVDIFFVISGYLISNIIYAEIANSTFSIKNFFIRRIRRIVPSLISLLIFVNILTFFVLDQDKVLTTYTNSVAALFFVSNIFFSRMNTYFGGEIEYNLIINLWSLSIEEQFYIIFPFFILLISKFHMKRHISIFLGIFFISLFSKSELVFSTLSFLNKIFFSLEGYLFYSPSVRVFEFVFGILIMLFRFQINKNFLDISKNTRNIIFATLLIFLFFKLGVSNSTLILISCTLTSILLLSNEHLERYSFSNLKILENIGLISYSLYLFHQPILAAIKNHNLNTTLYGRLHIDLENIFVVFFVFIFIIMISLINFTFIENKLRKNIFFKNNYKKYFLVMLTLFIILSSILLTSDGYDFRFTRLSYPETVQDFDVKFGTNYIVENNNLCINKDYIEATCKFNFKESNKSIYLVGNSIISSLTTGFLQEKYKDRYSIIEYTRQGCSLRHETCDYYPGSLKYDELYNIENSIIFLDSNAELNLVDYEIINKADGLLINSISMNEAQKREKVEQLNLTIKRLTEKNNQVVIIEPIPKPFINLKMFEFVNKISLNLDYDSWVVYKNNALEIYNQINNENFHTVSLDDVFCENKVCNFSTENHYLYIDDTHLNYFGAKLVADFIINEIKDY